MNPKDGQTLPAGLTIKGRRAHVAQTAAYKPTRWFLHDNCDDESAYIDYDGNWSAMPMYLATPEAAIEFCYLHADLPKIDGRQPKIERVGKGRWHITSEAGGCLGRNGWHERQFISFSSARAAYELAAIAAARLDGEAKSQVRINAERDPHYCPYCLRCSGNVRMVKVEPFLWRCKCGAIHDERDAQPPEAAKRKTGRG